MNSSCNDRYSRNVKIAKRSSEFRSEQQVSWMMAREFEAVVSDPNVDNSKDNVVKHATVRYVLLTVYNNTTNHVFLESQIKTYQLGRTWKDAWKMMDGVIFK